MEVPRHAAFAPALATLPLRLPALGEERGRPSVCDPLG